MVPVMGKRERNRRIKAAVRRIEGYEHALRDELAALIELSEPGDDLAAECGRLLAALDG